MRRLSLILLMSPLAIPEYVLNDDCILYSCGLSPAEADKTYLIEN